jgi:hypothetical protein
VVAHRARRPGLTIAQRRGVTPSARSQKERHCSRRGLTRWWRLASGIGARGRTRHGADHWRVRCGIRQGEGAIGEALVQRGLERLEERGTARRRSRLRAWCRPIRAPPPGRLGALAVPTTSSIQNSSTARTGAVSTFWRSRRRLLPLRGGTVRTTARPWRRRAGRRTGSRGFASARMSATETSAYPFRAIITSAASSRRRSAVPDSKRRGRPERAAVCAPGAGPDVTDSGAPPGWEFQPARASRR